MVTDETTGRWSFTFSESLDVYKRQDLNGVSGALMATTNMQMQTFVTQPNGAAEGFDGYNRCV